MSSAHAFTIWLARPAMRWKFFGKPWTCGQSCLGELLTMKVTRLTADLQYATMLTSVIVYQDLFSTDQRLAL